MQWRSVLYVWKNVFVTCTGYVLVICEYWDWCTYILLSSICKKNQSAILHFIVRSCNRLMHSSLLSSMPKLSLDPWASTVESTLSKLKYKISAIKKFIFYFGRGQVISLNSRTSLFISDYTLPKEVIFQ